jgi:hypothetical protein
MIVGYSCPEVGRIEYILDEAAIMAALYPLVKAQLEIDYILTPR